MKILAVDIFLIIFIVIPTGNGSKLEKVTYNIWKDKYEEQNYTQWQLGAYNPNRYPMPPNNAKPDKMPAFRCYLGESSSYQYEGKTKKADLRNWLGQLASLYAEQSAEVTLDSINEAQRNYHILLIAFPDGPRHHEVEDMVYSIASETESCKAMAVHLNSAHVKTLKSIYGVTKYPSVVIMHNHVVNDTIIEDNTVLAGQEVKKHVLKVFMAAYSVGVPILDLEAFENLVLNKKDDPTWKFTPGLICFYAHWAQDVFGYLDAFSTTVEQYRKDNVNLVFGLVDLVKESSKKLARRHLLSGSMKKIPFLSLFYQDEGSLRSEYMHMRRPYPWLVYDYVKNLNKNILDETRILPYKEPWEILSFDQYCDIQEGPNGIMCTPWSHNMTDNSPRVRIRLVKKRVLRKPTIVEKKLDEPSKSSLHDLFDIDMIERKLDRHNTLPLLTQETWTDVVEKSHAPRHIFYKSGRWAGEVTKVSLVVFIMADCGNCRRKNETFREIRDAVIHIDGGSMYYVNCTAEPVLCSNHNIRGYPTITAYRGLGWMDPMDCLSNKSQEDFQRYVRMDYHGIIQTKPVLEWFSNIADNSVTNINTGKAKLPQKFQDKDVKLVAQVKSAVAMDTEMKPGSYWNYKCLRLLCEQLYSFLECFSVSSENLPDNADIMVNKLTLERRDGVIATIMERNVPLLVTMEDETNELLHMFHKPHSYDINMTQTCEDDVTVCTNIIRDFILDHSRLPVTPITSDMFHTSISMLKDENLPILIALAHTEDLMETSQFYMDLTSVAYDLYNDLVVMTLNVNMYSVWATQFVPAMYGHSRACKH
ncbi:hypothetical protein ACF0H5_005408 [Mactra antiquata]